jgi:hypothetical protein
MISYRETSARPFAFASPDELREFSHHGSGSLRLLRQIAFSRSHRNVRRLLLDQFQAQLIAARERDLLLSEIVQQWCWSQHERLTQERSVLLSMNVMEEVQQLLSTSALPH